MASLESGCSHPVTSQPVVFVPSSGTTAARKKWRSMPAFTTGPLSFSTSSSSRDWKRSRSSPAAHTTAS
jgi:hypothetical protein